MATTSQGGPPPPPQGSSGPFTRIHHHTPYDFISPTRPGISAAGKNVIVTGGGSGIGKSIATRLCRAGAKSVCRHRPPRERTAVSRGRHNSDPVGCRRVRVVVGPQPAPPDARALRSGRPEVADQTLAAVTSIRDAVGPIDIFVSNVAALGGTSPVLRLDAASLAHTFELNCITTLHALVAFAATAPATTTDHGLYPRPPSPPVLINISSIAVPMPPLPQPLGGPEWSLVAYSSTKAASLKLVQHFAAENPAFHVVSVHPGLVWSEMTETAFPRAACPDDGASPLFISVFFSTSAKGRKGG